MSSLINGNGKGDVTDRPAYGSGTYFRGFAAEVLMTGTFFLFGLISSVSAQESAAFLKLGVGARAIGMGGAYTAVADDVNALSWNPAGLSRLSKRELGFTHAELVAGVRYDVVGYAHPLGFGTLAGGAAYLTQGTIEGRDGAGRITGGFSAHDSALTLGYAAKVSGTRLGATMKVLQSQIANVSAQTAAFDLGAQYELSSFGPGRPMLGISVLNVGPGLKFQEQRSPLPLTIGAGLGYRLPLGMIIALDVKNHPNAKDSEVSVGTEYAMLSGFAMRAGYGSARAVSASRGAATALSGFATGFGLKALGYTLDYSITPFGELGNVQRFSLGARF